MKSDLFDRANRTPPFFFEIGSHRVAQAGLELWFLLPLGITCLCHRTQQEQAFVKGVYALWEQNILNFVCIFELRH